MIVESNRTKEMGSEGGKQGRGRKVGIKIKNLFLIVEMA
jgi:hypothetical protein